MISAPSALFYMQQGNFHGVLYTQGSKLIKKSSRNFVTRYANLVQKSSYCIVLSVAYQNKILACSTCVKKLLKMVNDQRNGVVHVISQLNYAIFRLKEHLQRENKLILSFLYLFQQKLQQSGNCYRFYFERAKVKTSHKFVTSPDILVTKEKNIQSQIPLYWSQFRASYTSFVKVQENHQY